MIRGKRITNTKIVKILFQGGSITDAHRDRGDIHNLGNGYPQYAADGVHPTPYGAAYIGALYAQYIEKLL